MRVTIKDVAKKAGVTVGTVSRALNGYMDINEDTKKRILEVAAELEYTPNAVAKSLSSRTSRNIGIILTNFLQTDARDCFSLQLLQGIYRYAVSHGYEASIYMSDENSHTRLSYQKFCVQHNISGAILSGITTSDPYFKELVTAGMPCVLIDVHLKGKGLGCVSVDNGKAISEMTEYLCQNHHKNIMVLAGKREAAVNVERLAGIYEVLNRHGIAFTRENVAYCDFSEEKAYAFTLDYLKKYGKGKATAFECLSDLMAFGCMRAINELGYSIPEDFSVTGFDGHPIATYISPQLTTIGQDFGEIGYQSAKLLEKLIQDPELNEEVYVDFQFLERNSVREL